MRAIVVGGGVIGVTGAYALARDGWQVSVLDEACEPAMGASWGNGRQLSYSYTDALAQPGLLASLPRLALGLDDAFRMSMPLSVSAIGWLARFLRNCTSQRARRNTLDCLALALQSREELHALLARHDIDFAHKVAGKMVLYRDGLAFAKAQHSMAMKVAHGAELQVLAAEEIAHFEPALRGQQDLVGAIYAHGDETGDCSSFTRQLMAIATAEHGARFVGNTSVAAISRHGTGAVVQCTDGEELPADLVVVSAGFRSSALLRPLGHSLPIQPMKGYSFIAPAGPLAPEKSVTDAGRRIVFTNLGDEVLVAGLADLGNGSHQCDTGRMAQLLSAAQASLPDAALYEQAHSQWCGHRPVTPNSLPYTQMLKPWLAVNSGQGMLGWTLAMGSAARLAEAVRQASGAASTASGMAPGTCPQQRLAG